MTNSLPVMWELGRDTAINLVAIGGELFHREGYFRGPALQPVLRELRADKLFLGISSIEAEHGLSEVHLSEVPMKRAMIQASRQRVVLAHGSKVGRASHFHVCSVSEVDMLITDPSADPAAIEELQQAGLKVHVAGRGGTGTDVAERHEMGKV